MSLRWIGRRSRHPGSMKFGKRVEGLIQAGVRIHDPAWLAPPFCRCLARARVAEYDRLHLTGDRRPATGA